MTEMGRRNWSDSQKAAAMTSRIPLGKFAGQLSEAGLCSLQVLDEKKGLHFWTAVLFKYAAELAGNARLLP